MKFLDKFLSMYPGNPSQALWRAIEAEALVEAEFRAPLLDLGCGDGRFASVLFGRLGVKPAAGCDLSPEKVARAQALELYGEVVAADILTNRTAVCKTFCDSIPSGRNLKVSP